MPFHDNILLEKTRRLSFFVMDFEKSSGTLSFWLQKELEFFLGLSFLATVKKKPVVRPFIDTGRLAVVSGETTEGQKPAKIKHDPL